MNKLEEQIQNACIRNNSVNGEIPYRNGAQFVIDLELPVKFAGWIQSDCRYYNDSVYDGRWFINNVKLPFGDIKELYTFWIENIYGR